MFLPFPTYCVLMAASFYPLPHPPAPWILSLSSVDVLGCSILGLTGCQAASLASTYYIPAVPPLVENHCSVPLALVLFLRFLFFSLWHTASILKQSFLPELWKTCFSRKYKMLPLSYSYVTLLGTNRKLFSPLVEKDVFSSHVLWHILLCIC